MSPGDFERLLKDEETRFKALVKSGLLKGE
jgi:hypothetical protein